MDLGPHAVFIWASYGLTALSVGAILVWLMLDGRRQRRLLAELEAAGIGRRPSSQRDATKVEGRGP